MIKSEDVTIIIPHFGEDERATYALEQTLDSLTETCESKIIVATNGEKNPQPHFRGFVFKGKTIVYKQVDKIHVGQQGQCKATNAAVATTNTPWIMVSNDDMVYPPGWFEKLTVIRFKGIDSGTANHIMLEAADIQCISPQLIEPRDGAPTFEKQMFGGVGGDFQKQKFSEFAEKHTGGYLRTGFNLPFLISRDLWDIVGGYDIQYDPWGSNSDSDLEYKIKLAGVQPYQNTNSIVYHFSNTSGTFEPRNNAFWQENFAKFEKKWGFPRTDDGIWEASFKIPDKGRIFRPEWEGKYGKV